jgi:hypothetical protein
MEIIQRMIEQHSTTLKDHQDSDVMQYQINDGSLCVNNHFFSAQDTKNSPPKRPRQRSVRGESSMVESINSRLCDTDKLIKELESKNHIIGKDIHSLFDQLVNIAEKSDSIIQPLIQLEKDIDKNKQLIPNYKKFHRIYIEIQKSRDFGDVKSADELEKNQDSNYHKFHQLYGSLVPLINKARELRYELLNEKRKLLSIQYNLMRESLYLQTREIFEIVENNFDDASQFKEYLKILKPWNNISEFKFATCKQGAPVTRQIAILEDDINTLTEQVDDALPTASDFINKIAHLIEKEIKHLTPAS